MSKWKEFWKGNIPASSMVLITVLALGIGFFAGVRYADSVYLKIQSGKSQAGMNLPEGHPAISQAEGLGQGMDYQEAIRSLETQVKKEPGNSSLLIQLGNLYSDIGQFPQAGIYYERALKIEPSLADVWVDCGVAYREIKQSEKALACFKTALSCDSAHPIAWYNLGVVYQYDFHQPAEAKKAWQSFLKMAPDSPLAPQIRQQLNSRIN